MNEEEKKKYQLLKEKNKRKVKEANCKNDALLQECIISLKECIVLSLENTRRLFNKFASDFSLSLTGSINWNEFNGEVCTEEMSYICKLINLQNQYCILWDKQDTPGVICDLSTILNCIDDVLAVSFNTWLLSMDGKEVIEFYHEGVITYGKLE